MAIKKLIIGLACLSAMLLSGCTSLLPKEEKHTEFAPASFAEAKANFEKIVPYESKIEDLKQLGYDPFANPNMTILTYADIVRRFIPGTGVKEEDLDHWLGECVALRDECRGYEIEQKILNRKRVGNFLLDFLNFKRTVEVSGWRFNGLIILNGDLVVHTLWGGQPLIHEFEEDRNPLGPFQGAGASIK